MMQEHKDRSRISYYATLMVLASLFAVLFYSATWLTGDEARYYVPAWSLAHGYGYTDAAMPGRPPETMTPPLQAFLISLIIRSTDNPIALAKAVGSIWYILYALLTAMLVRRLFSTRPGTAWAVSVMALFALPILVVTPGLMADLPFMALVAFAFLLLHRAESSRSPGWMFSVGMVASLAYLTRAVGLALVAGIALHLLLHRRWKELLWYLAGAVLLYAPWQIRNLLVATNAESYFSYASKVAGGSGVSDLPVMRLVRQFTIKFPPYLHSVLPSILFPHLIEGRNLLGILGLGFLAAPFRWGVAALVAVGFGLSLRRFSAMELYWILTWVLISIFPFPGFYPYYLFPMVFIAAIYVARSVGVLSDMATRGNRQRSTQVRGVILGGMAAYVLAIALTSGVIHWRKEQPRRAYAPTAPERYRFYLNDYYDAWSTFAEAAEWIRNHTPQNALVASRKPGHYFVLSDRQGWRYDEPNRIGYSNAWDAVMGMGRDAPVYVVEDAFAGQGEHSTWYGESRVHVLEPLLQEHADAFELVFTSSKPSTRVWRYIP
ncbi:MAG: glycosyltransferase family 39 protein [Kiritimatiellae bacterium]|nr:glycosyltransferase family 39 protein [Kiritimatiellia bacterium]